MIYNIKGYLDQWYLRIRVYRSDKKFTILIYALKFEPRILLSKMFRFFFFFNPIEKINRLYTGNVTFPRRLMDTNGCNFNLERLCHGRLSWKLFHEIRDICTIENVVQRSTTDQFAILYKLQLGRAILIGV